MAMTRAATKWYARYPGDYGRKTRHLSMTEHGAYALLLDHYYNTGKPLPANAEQLHRICMAFADDEQAACMAVLHEFFVLRDDGWHNDRADEELLKRSEISEKRSKAASRRGANAPAKAPAIDTANAPAKADTTTTTIYDDDDSAYAREASEPAMDPTTRERILAAMGVGPDGVAGPSKFIGGRGDMAHVERWLALPGLTVPAITEEIRRVMSAKGDGPPSSFKYFDGAMQKLSATLTAPALSPTLTKAQVDEKAARRERWAKIRARHGGS